MFDQCFYALPVALMPLNQIKENRKMCQKEPHPPVTCLDTDNTYTHLVCVSACLGVCHIPELTLRWVGKMRRTHEEGRVERQDRSSVNGTLSNGDTKPIHGGTSCWDISTCHCLTEVPQCPKCYVQVFCTRLDDGSEQCSDDNVDRGDDFRQYNDHRGGAVMIHAVALYCK